MQICCKVRYSSSQVAKPRMWQLTTPVGTFGLSLHHSVCRYYREHASGKLSHNCFYAIYSEKNNIIVPSDIQYWQLVILFWNLKPLESCDYVRFSAFI